MAEPYFNRKIFGLYRPDYCRQHLHDQFSLGQELEITIDVSDDDAGRVKLNTICPGEYPFTEFI
jgi:protocatechuate 3,4-dioxygenase beta subunit